MELFKRAVNESNIKNQIKEDLIKHLDKCKCNEKKAAPKTNPKAVKFEDKFKGL